MCGYNGATMQWAHVRRDMNTLVYVSSGQNTQTIRLAEQVLTHRAQTCRFPSYGAYYIVSLCGMMTQPIDRAIDGVHVGLAMGSLVHV